MSAVRLFKFIHERHAIWERRATGEKWPWTKDKILRQYRFCNVYRNLDKETKLIHANWLMPHKKDEDVWFAMVVARLVNWWPSLEAVGYPVPWVPSNFGEVLEARKAAGEKVFTGAYMVRADANDTGSKAVYLANRVLSPMWADRVHVRPRKGDTLEAFHARLKLYRDMGDFMAAQIVADAKYVGLLLGAPDWGTWAAPGPGSLRGLNRVLDRDKNASWTKHNSWKEQFEKLHAQASEELQDMPYITGQDLQNCLCEFDKYERVRLGEGRPRALYHREGENQ